MPNQIIPVVWEKPLRKSAVNTLDKLNEVIDFINTSDIHEFSFIDGDTGREVVSGTSTQLALLDVFGECVQDGTPTPENPVPVQVVEGINIWNEQWELGRYDTSTGAPVTANDRIRCKDPISIQPNTDYCFTGANFVIYWYDQADQYISFSTPDSGTVRTSPSNAQYLRFNCVAAYGTTYNHDICVNRSNPALNGVYAPYGCIVLQIGNDITPIDLQGNTLAGLPDGTRDVLYVNSAGRVWIEQNVTKITWDSFTAVSVNVLRVQAYTQANPDIQTPATGAELPSGYCTHLLPLAWSATSTTGYFIVNINNGAIGWNFPTDAPNTLPELKVAYPGVYSIHPLKEPIAHELGTITPPPIPSGSVIKIAASLQPEFNIQWWTESAIPSVINDLKAYVDEQIETVNARIDELHGITRTAVVRPDASIPAIEFEPIEKTTVNDIVETDVEKEN